jgi:hypothetical protein
VNIKLGCYPLKKKMTQERKDTKKENWTHRKNILTKMDFSKKLVHELTAEQGTCFTRFEEKCTLVYYTF